MRSGRERNNQRQREEGEPANDRWGIRSDFDTGRRRTLIHSDSNNPKTTTTHPQFREEVVVTFRAKCPNSRGRNTLLRSLATPYSPHSGASRPSSSHGLPPVSARCVFAVALSSCRYMDVHNGALFPVIRLLMRSTHVWVSNGSESPCGVNPTPRLEEKSAPGDTRL